MAEREMQAIAVTFVVLALGLVYVGHQANDLRGQVNDLQEANSTIVETLYQRMGELEELIIECGVTIDNGAGTTTHTVYLTKGASALEALRRIAVVETTYYSELGEFIDSVNGIGNDPEVGKYWMWYIWGENEAWTPAPEGAGNYELKDGDNIKFSYEAPSW